MAREQPFNCVHETGNTKRTFCQSKYKKQKQTTNYKQSNSVQLNSNERQFTNRSDQKITTKMKNYMIKKSDKYWLGTIKKLDWYLLTNVIDCKQFVTVWQQ